jgi:hypothetical protein
VREQHALQRVVDLHRVGEVFGVGLPHQRVERPDQPDQQFMHHLMLGLQPIGDLLPGLALLRKHGEKSRVLDRMVGVDNLAVLAAQISEPPEIMHHGQRLGFLLDLPSRLPARHDLVDHRAQHLGVLPQMIVDRLEMLAVDLLLRRRIEPGRHRARGIV